MPSFDASHRMALLTWWSCTEVPRLDLESYILNYKGPYLRFYASWCRSL